MTQKVTFSPFFIFGSFFVVLHAWNRSKITNYNLLGMPGGLKLLKIPKLKKGEKSGFLGHFLGGWLTLDPIFGPQMRPYGPGHEKLLCQACPGVHFGTFTGIYRPTIAEKYPKNCYFQRFPTLELNISFIVAYPLEIFGTMFTPP